MKHDPELTDRYWTRDADGRTRLGLNPHAAESLRGEWVALELPAPGRRVMRGDTFGFVTTSAAVYDLRAPFTFRVLAVNEAAVVNPRLASLSPTGVGWLLEVEPGGPEAVA